MSNLISSFFNSIDFKPYPIEGDIVGCSHWEEVTYRYVGKGKNEKGEEVECYKTRRAIRDKSTGNIYKNDTRLELFQKATLITCSSPFYLAGTVAFHVLRLIPVIFYLVGRIFYDYAFSKTKDSFLSVCFQKLEELDREIDRSIKNIVRSLLYYPLYVITALYTMISPYNGRKMLAAYEKAWNHGIDVDYSIHLCYPRKYWTFSLLGDNGLYIPGCFQPIATSKVGELDVNSEFQRNCKEDSPWERLTILSQDPACFF